MDAGALPPETLQRVSAVRSHVGEALQPSKRHPTGPSGSCDPEMVTSATGFHQAMARAFAPNGVPAQLPKGLAQQAATAVGVAERKAPAGGRGTSFSSRALLARG